MSQPAVFIRLKGSLPQLDVDKVLEQLRALGYAVIAMVEPSDPNGKITSPSFCGVIECGNDSKSSASIRELVAGLADQLSLDRSESWVISSSINDVQFMETYDRDAGVLIESGSRAKSALKNPLVATVVPGLTEAVEWVERHTFDDSQDESNLPNWLPVQDSNQPQPFFVVGAERSGTTLLRLIISAHPEIACHSEFEYAVDWLDPETHTVPIDEFTKQLAGHRKFPVLYETRPMLEAERQVNVDHAMVTRGFLEQYRRENGVCVVGATVHRHFDRILDVWPDARFIHICRDPRDVAQSNVKMGWAGTPYHGVGTWIEAELLWKKLAAKVGKARYVEVQYEAIIESPQRELTRLCEFLRLQYAEEMMSYHESSTYEPLNPALTYQWKRKMPASDVRYVETRLGAMLTDSGYKPSGLAPLQDTRFRKTWLAIRGKIQRWRWRIDRYGLGLLLRHAIAKKLGMHAARDCARRDMQDIDTSKLK